MESVQQSRFEGWAIVDVLGHQRFAGMVTTEYFGSATFFRVDTPARDQRETIVGKESEYVGNGYGYCPEGTKVVRAAEAGELRLIGAGSIYMLTPSTREAVIAHLDEASPCKVLSVTTADGTPREVPEEQYF